MVISQETASSTHPGLCISESMEIIYQSLSFPETNRAQPTSETPTALHRELGIFNTIETFFRGLFSQEPNVYTTVTTPFGTSVVSPEKLKEIKTQIIYPDQWS